MFKTLETRILLTFVLLSLDLKTLSICFTILAGFEAFIRLSFLSFMYLGLSEKKKENNYYWSLNLFGTFMSSVFYYRLPVGRKVTFFNTFPSNLMISFSECKRGEEFSEAEAEEMTSKLN